MRVVRVRIILQSPVQELAILLRRNLAFSQRLLDELTHRARAMVIDRRLFDDALLLHRVDVVVDH